MAGQSRRRIFGFELQALSFKLQERAKAVRCNADCFFLWLKASSLNLLFSYIKILK
jgi:hypothetical protein